MDAYEERRCEELRAITFTFHSPVCAWAKNIVLTRSQSFILLLLSHGTWWENFDKMTQDCTYKHSYRQTNNHSFTLSLSVTCNTQACRCCSSGLYPVKALKFCKHRHDFSLHWHLLWEQQQFCDRRWMENEGRFFQATAGGWDTNERQETPIKLRRVSEKQRQRLIKSVCWT